MKRTILLAALALLAAAPALPAQITVVSSTLDEQRLAPGERHSGTLRLHNGSDRPQQATIRAADYRFLADGRTFFDEPGTGERSNASWIRFEPAELTLAPGEEAVVPYTVQVPAGAHVRGSYWSVLLVETGRPEAASRTQRGVGIRPSIRYAVQIATHVGEGDRRIALEGARVARDGGPALEVDVLNTGQHADRLELRLDLFQDDGTPAGSLAATRGLLYPGSSLHQRFELSALPAGSYRALLVIDTGSDEVFGAEYTLTL